MLLKICPSTALGLGPRRRQLFAATMLPAGPPDAAELRAATFNLRYDNAADGANARPERRAAALALIRGHRFDLMATLIDDQQYGHDPSDHFPVLVRLRPR